MNKQIKRFCVTVIIVLVIACIYNPKAYASIAANWRECASSPGCSCTVTSQVAAETTTTLKTYVIESAGYFLKSHATYQEFLYCFEMSESKGLDFNALKSTLDNAIGTMEKAKAAYAKLKSASEKIPYNQAMIDQLLKFDYDDFQSKNGLNGDIFKKLSAFLGKGDIAGFDGAVIENMDTILIMLYQVKGSVEKGLAPEICILWRTNQAYSEAQLFAQYMSEVFRAILF